MHREPGRIAGYERSFSQQSFSQLVEYLHVAMPLKKLAGLPWTKKQKFEIRPRIPLGAV